MVDVTGLTVVLPQSLDSLQPIEIHDRTGLKSILVERYALDKLPQEWVKAEGFYVLLSHINPDNTFIAYIGQTDYSFTQRLKDHTEKKDFWRVAILFKRETDNNPFTRTETRYLEGLLHDALKSSPNVTITNIKPVGEKNMPDYNKPYMDTMLLAALRVLFLRGYRNAHLGTITNVLENQPSQPNPYAAPTFPTKTPATTNPASARNQPPTVFTNLTPQKLTTPAEQPSTLTTTTTRKPETDEELHQALRKICQNIRNNHPEAESGYKYWASEERLRTLIREKPQTFQQLARINGVGKNLLLGAEEIITLFQPSATEEKTKKKRFSLFNKS